jgi:hypothetical protein
LGYHQLFKFVGWLPPQFTWFSAEAWKHFSILFLIFTLYFLPKVMLVVAVEPPRERYISAAAVFSPLLLACIYFHYFQAMWNLRKSQRA